MEIIPSTRLCRKVIALLAFLSCYVFASAQSNNKLLQYVDPFIGTDGIGHTFPGATTPFGMIQLSPSDDTPAWNWCSGYHYSDNTIKGFAHNHFSGTGLSGMGDILLMPTTGKVTTNSGTKKNPETGYRSRFSHKNEVASPGYYKVYLDDYQVTAELTATPRVGMHRYQFGANGPHNVIFDLTHAIHESVGGTEIKFLSDTEIQGAKMMANGSCGPRTVYFYAKCSKPFARFGISIDDKLSAQQKTAKASDAKAYIQFDGKRKESVEIAVALSYVSYEGAKENYLAEAAGKSFDQIHRETQKVWAHKLQKIIIDGTDVQKKIFYTAMYRNYIAPNIISDVDGQFVVQGKVYQATKGVQYSNFSTWDTYRATHPLLTIVDEKENRGIIRSLISRMTETKTGLPLWEALGHDNFCMPGKAGIAVIAEAMLKDPTSFDAHEIFPLLKAEAIKGDKSSGNYGWHNGVKDYARYGFVPAKYGCGVSKTVENNYYDFALAQVAEKIKQPKDAQELIQRSIGYRHLYNKKTKYLWPKNLQGDFLQMDTLYWKELIPNYISGNIWSYSAYTPHDMFGAIALQGGKKKYAQWLDGIVTVPANMKGEEHVDIAGFIGKYSHGDEPGHQLAYLYNFVDQPWKTQALVRQVQTEMYSDQPSGLVNNEDCGQMSAWYIFSAMGFYPVSPADLNYYIGSPLQPKASIHLENGKQFTVIANNVSVENKYIQSCVLNGKPYNKLYISHHTIMRGGTLVFEMGAKPNKKWGVSSQNLPAYQQQMADRPTKQMACYMPYACNKQFVFENKDNICLTSNNTDAVIRYTLDGTEPNENSAVYTTPISIDCSLLLKAKAYKVGINPSVTYEKRFVKTIFTSLDNGYPKVAFEQVPAKYGAKDGSQLIDREEASKSFRDGKWTGINHEDLAFTVDLGRPCKASMVTINTLTDTKVWRFPPKQILVQVLGKDGKYYTVAQEAGSKLQERTKEIIRHTLKFNEQSVQYLRIVLVNYGPLPSWHIGAGQKPWIHADQLNIE